MPNARPEWCCEPPVAAQRCAEGAGLDSGTVVAAQSAMPSIAILWSAPTADDFPPTPTVAVAPQLEPRISTSLTDVTFGMHDGAHPRFWCAEPLRCLRDIGAPAVDDWRTVSGRDRGAHTQCGSAIVERTKRNEELHLQAKSTGSKDRHQVHCRPPWQRHWKPNVA